MKKTCKACGTSFEITQDDLAFLDHVSPIFAGKKCPIPPPTHCPMCRLKRRLAYRNNIALFQRPAYPDGGMIFSMHPATAPFPVMRNEDWFGDGWEPLDYTQEFSFERPFFEQFKELNAKAPKYARIGIRNENCDFCNNSSINKNCYLCFSISFAEDCMCCEDSWGSKDCLDCNFTLHSELCYDCTDCLRCYNVQSSEFSEHCSDSFFLSFCRSCKNCFGCVNLHSQQYCIFNEQKTKEEYEAFVRSFRGESFQERKAFAERFDAFKLQFPRPHATLHQTENCAGNFIVESRNVRESYFIQYGEDLKYCFNLFESVNDCMDYSFSGRKAELIYECCTCVITVSRLLFCMLIHDGSSDLIYCYGCVACKDCFGCSGLRKKQYCIFNKQYTKEQYEELVPKIIAHMQTTGEWGEFFPSELCTVPYNRSHAQRYFPLTKEEALRSGYVWLEEDAKEFPDAVAAEALPDTCSNNASAFVVQSARSGRPFRITSQEVERCRAFHAPLPRTTYDERMDERAKKLGGIALYERSCAKTGKKVLTTYPSDSPYIVWDKDAYEEEFQ